MSLGYEERVADMLKREHRIQRQNGHCAWCSFFLNQDSTELKNSIGGEGGGRTV